MDLEAHCNTHMKTLYAHILLRVHIFFHANIFYHAHIFILRAYIFILRAHFFPVFFTRLYFNFYTRKKSLHAREKRNAARTHKKNSAAVFLSLLHVSNT